MSDSALIINTIDEINAKHGMKALRPIKARTDGGSYEGPCVRCKIEGRGSPLGGDNRLVVKIGRPAVSPDGSRYGPVFFCRQCPCDANGYKWSGDLVAYVMMGTDMTFLQALESLGIDPMTHGSNGKRTLALTFSMQGLSPQNTKWVEEGNKFIHTSMQNLFDPEYADCLEFQKIDRGLSEDILHRAMIGWNENERYEDASKWGMGKGRIKIHRGFVYPEYHLNKNHEMLLYSIAIRRIKSDLEDEQLLTGKIPSKTMVLADSNKSLYMGSTIKRGKICILVEGQSDTLSILDVGQGRWASAATQGVTGARTSQTMADVLLWLSQADVVVIMFDGDEAGKTNAEYWTSLLDYSIVIAPPAGKDPNSMLVEGSLYKFCERAERMAYEAYPGRRAKSSVDVAQNVLEPEVVTLEPEVCKEDSVFISGPNIRSVVMSNGVELDTHDWNTMPPTVDLHPEVPYHAPAIALSEDEILIDGEIFKRQKPRPAPVVVESIPVEVPKVSGVAKVKGKNSKGNKKSRTEVVLTGEEVNIASYWAETKPVQEVKVTGDTPALITVSTIEEAIRFDTESEIERVFTEGCSRCGGEVDHIDYVSNRAYGRCESFPGCEAPDEGKCGRCGAKMAVRDKMGHSWCVEHMHCQRLLDLGEEVSYRGFYVAPVMDYHRPFSEEPDKYVAPFMMPGGKQKYLEFATQAPIEKVWAAAGELSTSKAFATSLKNSAPPPPPVNPHPCARIGAGCERDYTKLHRVGDEVKWDYVQKKNVPANFVMLGGIDVEIDGSIHHFCYTCFDAGAWLEIGKKLGYPKDDKVEAGQKPWMAKALTDEDLFYFTMQSDSLRRRYKDKLK